MNSHLRRYCLAAALVGLAGPAAAQTWVYEPDYYAARAYQPAVTAPVAVAPTQRTIVTRTIIPQRHGRAPIVKERIVSETVAPAPVVRERVVTRPVVAESYAYAPGYAYAPVARERVVTRPVVVTDDYAYSGYAYAPAVRERVIRRPAMTVDYVAPTDAYAMAPVVTTAPAVTPYRYRYINNRLLLVDPVTGAVVGQVQD
jgi:hypothetical protein